MNFFKEEFDGGDDGKKKAQPKVKYSQFTNPYLAPDGLTGFNGLMVYSLRKLEDGEFVTFITKTDHEKTHYRGTGIVDINSLKMDNPKKNYHCHIIDFTDIDADGYVIPGEVSIKLIVE